VRDSSDIKRASDLLAKNKITLTWGPLRHIIGHNIAIYHKNPDGVVIEFFCEMDQMHDEELGFFEPRPWHQDPAAAAKSVGRRYAVQLVGTDVSQSEPRPYRGSVAVRTGEEMTCYEAAIIS
jgi:hypothetical protein